jgi:hypothetical protein
VAGTPTTWTAARIGVSPVLIFRLALECQESLIILMGIKTE